MPPPTTSTACSIAPLMPVRPLERLPMAPQIKPQPTLLVLVVWATAYTPTQIPSNPLSVQAAIAIPGKHLAKLAINSLHTS